MVFFPSYLKFSDKLADNKSQPTARSQGFHQLGTAKQSTLASKKQNEMSRKRIETYCQIPRAPIYAFFSDIGQK
jgi:hypothetical protein